MPRGSLAPDKTRNAQVEPFRQPQSRAGFFRTGAARLIMDGGSQNLLHLQLQVDPLEPRRGVLELLRRLRPQWKPQEVHLKVVLRFCCTCLTGFFPVTSQTQLETSSAHWDFRWNS